MVLGGAASIWCGALVVALIACGSAMAEPPQPKFPSRLVAKPIDPHRSLQRVLKAKSRLPSAAIEVPADLTQSEARDDFEPFNRTVFAVNEAVDKVVLEPVARVYRFAVPRPVRRGVSNVLRNAGAPITLANDLLQGERRRAGETMTRFMVNSTVGLGGVFDVAARAGIEYHYEDFGQTLAVWGVGPGPYMVVPILGPSNPRDLTGRLVDTFANPVSWLLIDEPLEVRAAPGVGSVIVGREAVLDEVARLRATSPDFYLTVRDIYHQKRQSEISNGDFAGEPIPDMSGVSDISGIPVIDNFVGGSAVPK